MREMVLLIVILSLIGAVYYVVGLAITKSCTWLSIQLDKIRCAPELLAVALEFQEMFLGKEEQLKELEKRSGFTRNTEYLWWYVESTKYSEKPLHPTAQDRRTEREKQPKSRW